MEEMRAGREDGRSYGGRCGATMHWTTPQDLGAWGADRDLRHVSARSTLALMMAVSIYEEPLVRHL